MQTASARAREVLARASLDDGNVNARQRQLTRQHQPSRACPGDHHCMLAHHRTSIGINGTPTQPSTDLGDTPLDHSHSIVAGGLLEIS